MTMNDEQEHRRMIKDRLDFFLFEKLPIHLVLFRKLKTGEHIFLNGTLETKFNENGYWLNEDKLGKVRVFVSEIMLVEDYKK